METKKAKKLDIVQWYLDSEPKARERSNRAKAVWNLLAKEYGIVEGGTISKEFFIDGFFKDSQTFNRSINRIQQLNPHLRGSDYDDKERLEQEAQLEQGYTPGYNQDIKKLKTL
jgi:hypothetical protein